MTDGSRRAFLKALLAAPVVAAGAFEVDWERLLWVPKPLIVVPAMPNPSALAELMAESAKAFRVVLSLGYTTGEPHGSITKWTVAP